MTSSQATGTTTTLDEAFERLTAAGFELPNGFVNHGPMACEALDALGCDDEVDEWARRFARAGGTPVDPVAPAAFEWREALGDRRRLPEWIGLLEREIDEWGWEHVVELWVPRLLPALAVVLFHGAIRAAHAVRAVGVADTAPRRAELARALGYWAARWEPGAPSGPAGGPPRDRTGEVAPARSGEAAAGLDAAALRLAVVVAAGRAARHYLDHPGIVALHGVTGAMAVELFAPHLAPRDLAAGLAQVHAEHARLYGAAPAAASSSQSDEEPPDGGPPPTDVIRSAYRSGDPHEVKLVEACLRGWAATGDPAFAAAARLVTAARG